MYFKIKYCKLKRPKSLGDEKTDYNTSKSTVRKCGICLCTLGKRMKRKKKLIYISLVLFLPFISYEIFP